MVFPHHTPITHTITETLPKGYLEKNRLNVQGMQVMGYTAVGFKYEADVYGTAVNTIYHILN